jgi:sec-independent protein translocase protein TatA
MLSFLDPPEIALLVVLVLLLFGGTQLPKLAKNLGKAQQEFKKGLEAGRAPDTAPPATTETIEEKLARLDRIDKARAVEDTNADQQ